MTINIDECEDLAAELRNSLIDVVREFLLKNEDKFINNVNEKSAIIFFHLLSTFGAQIIGSMFEKAPLELLEKAVKQVSKQTIKHLRQNIKH